MEWLAVATAVGALFFSLRLFKSRPNPDGYGNVLVVMPLAVAVPMIALMSSGLQLITGFRRASTGEGLGAIAESVSAAAQTQNIGHIALLLLSATLAFSLVALALRPQESAPPQPEPSEDAEAPALPKLSRRHATSVMSIATLACLAAVATLTRFEQRFVTAPLAIVSAFEDDDMAEFSSNKRELDEMRRVISNTLVAETFRALIVSVLFFVLFDAMLTGSRGIAFNRSTLLVSAVLLILTASLTARSYYRQQQLGQEVRDALLLAESKTEHLEDEESELDSPEEPVPDPG